MTLKLALPFSLTRSVPFLVILWSHPEFVDVAYCLCTLCYCALSIFSFRRDPKSASLSIVLSFLLQGAVLGTWKEAASFMVFAQFFGALVEQFFGARDFLLTDEDQANYLATVLSRAKVLDNSTTINSAVALLEQLGNNTLPICLALEAHSDRDAKWSVSLRWPECVVTVIDARFMILYLDNPLPSPSFTTDPAETADLVRSRVKAKTEQ